MVVLSKVKKGKDKTTRCGMWNTSCPTDPINDNRDMTNSIQNKATVPLTMKLTNLLFG